jgi:TolB-like protein/DNA-binding SARP family transcriptional activator
MRAREVAMHAAMESTDSTSNNATEVLARWSLRLFGGFELRSLPGGEKLALPAKRERVLLAYLAVSPNFRQTRRKLATLLWGDAADETALDNLRTCIWSLRKALSDRKHRIIGSEGEDVVLDAAAFDADAVAFRGLAAQSGRVELEEAAKLYSGEFLDGVDIENEEFESWRREEASRYKAQAIDALIRLLTQLAECSETERAIEAGLQILRLEPLHEPAVCHLMRLYGTSGRRGPAIQLYRTLADTLRTELDAQPEAETRAVFAEVSHRGDGRTGAPVAEVAPDVTLPPYPASMVSPSDAPHEPLQPAQHLASADSAPQNVHGSSLGWILAGGLAAAMAIFLVYEFAVPAGTTSAQQVVEAAKASSSSQPGGISIAVLPFGNLSSDAGQEFFSDGMTEEITAALAKVPNLQVVARASAFQFKNANKDMRAVGQALGVRYLITGSVRRAASRVRITAQLVRTDSGVNVWSESYDREFTDVFAIQEEIARAITSSMRMPLGLAPGDSLVHGTRNLSTYQQYLQAKAWLRDRNSPQSGPFLQTLESVVARDPGFAPAWAQLARAYQFQITSSPAVPEGSVATARGIVQTFQDKAETAAHEAIRLDPRHPGGYSALANLRWAGGRWAEAEDSVKQALALDTNDPDALFSYSNVLLKTGQPRKALAVVQKLRTMEPLVPAYEGQAAMIMQVNGDNEAAIAIFEAVPTNARTTVTYEYLARAYAAAGRYAEAADTLIQAASATPNPQNRKPLQDAALILRSAPAKAENPKTLPALGRIEGDLFFVYASVGAMDRALDYPDREAQIRYMPDSGKTMWSAVMAPARKTERFKAFARNTGLVDYWRQKGWPEFCRPMGTDNFVCD